MLLGYFGVSIIQLYWSYLVTQREPPYCKHSCWVTFLSYRVSNFNIMKTDTFSACCWVILVFPSSNFIGHTWWLNVNRPTANILVEWPSFRIECPTSTLWRLTLLVHAAGLFWCFHHPPNSDMDYRIFNVCMSFFLHGCTHEGPQFIVSAEGLLLSLHRTWHWRNLRAPAKLSMQWSPIHLLTTLDRA